MSYFGGKAGAGTYQRIINLIPPHEVYIEPFAGAAAIWRYKKPASRSVIVDLDKAVLRRLPARSDTSVLQQDALGFLKDYEWSGREFVYCDPPYLWSTRRSKHRYQYELTDKQHLELIQILLTLPAAVMISGYRSKLYAAHLRTWSHRQFRVTTRGNVMATEHLWFNYPAPKVLHDYGYLGKDFTERQRIRRKIKRWTNRLKKLPPLERAAILEAISNSQK